MDYQILEWALQRTKYESYREAQAVAHIPAAFIAEMPDVLDSPQYEARGFFTELDHPDAGRLRFPGLPAQLSGIEWEHRRAPRLGEHTSEVLSALTDLTAEEIAEVRAAGGDLMAANRAPLPLDGIRVLDLGMFWAGPFAGKLMADAGAEVIKIESPSHPDNLRILARGGLPGRRGGLTGRGTARG